eukprot:Partr_v1_DN28990_c1_g1_i4_m25638 putative Jumonji domain containing
MQMPEAMVYAKLDSFNFFFFERMEFEIYREDKPCLLPVDSDILEWPIFSEWTSHASVDIKKLRSHIGNPQVPVSDAFGCTKSMSLSDFLDSPADSKLYLKNWHYCREFQDYRLYDPPFGDDWLDKWTRARNIDDFRFVYLGKDGSFTGLHADVFRSYSWSTNICGVKEWTFYRPADAFRLHDKFNNCISDISAHVDSMQFPHFDNLEPALVLLQHPGETIFVPSGWFHQVRNIGVTLSVNHNFVNAFNIVRVCEYYVRCWNEVTASIDHLKREMSSAEFYETCQLMQRQHYGMDMKQLSDFLSFVKSDILPSSHMNAILFGKKETLREFSTRELSKAIDILRSNDPLCPTLIRPP